jgi:uncharacterized protein YhjY with autotransporter beta-barrel domain
VVNGAIGSGGVLVGGTINASGSINGDVNNFGAGVLNTVGFLSIGGQQNPHTLNNYSTAAVGVDIGSGESLFAATINNYAAATIVNAGSLNSSSAIQNLGTLRTTGAINAAIDNRGTLDAAGSINGNVNLIGTGVLTTIGSLSIGGPGSTATLNNASTAARGVDIGAGEALFASNATNSLGSTIANAGSMTVGNTFQNFGTILNSGALTGSIVGGGTGVLRMEGGTFTGSASNLFGFGITAGSIGGSPVEALVNVTAIGGSITALSSAGTTVTNTTGDITVVAAAGSSLTGTAANPVIGTNSSGTTNITANGTISTSGTAISMNAGTAGGTATANIGGGIEAGTAFVGVGNTTFNVAVDATVRATNILDSNSGNSVLNNAGSISGRFGSGAGSTLVNNQAGATIALSDLGTPNSSVSLFGGASDQFANAGRLVSVSGATSLGGLELGLTNAGTGVVDLVDGAGNDSLTVGGNMSNLANSQIRLDADLDDDDIPALPAIRGDHVTVVGDLSSSGGVIVLNNIDVDDSFGQVVDLEVMRQILAPGTPDSGAAFSVLTPDNQSIFTYLASTQVISATETAIVINSQVDAQAAGGIVSNFVTAQNSVANAFFRPASGFVSAPLDPAANQLGFSPWFRTSGGYTGQGSRGVASLLGGPQAVESSVKVAFGGYQFGLDGGLFNIGGTGANLHVGLTAGQIIGVANQDNFNNKTDMTDTFVGAYGIFSNGPFFVDAQMRQEFIDYTVNADERGVEIVNGKDEARRFSAGISGGYAFTAGNFSIVPAAGYTFAKTSTDDLVFNLGTVEFDDTTSHLTFAGISVATSVLLFDDQLRVSPFISATAYHDFGKDQAATLELNIGDSIDITSGSGKTYGEVSLGANFLTLTPEIAGTQRLLSGNVRGDVQFGEDRLGGSVNAQVRLQF